MSELPAPVRPLLLVLASTYPRWADDPEPGFVHELCRRLAAGFEVVVVCPHAPGAKTHECLDGVEVVRYRYAPQALETLVHGGGMVSHLRRSPWKWLLVPGFVLGQWWAAARIARQRRPALVHAHWLLPQGLVAWALRAAGVAPRYVLTSHGADLYGLRGAPALALKRRVARACTAMSVVSSAMRGEAASAGLRPPRLEVIPMGADLQERFTPLPEVAREPGLILFVGRLVEKKGLPHLLEAMPTVLRARPDARLLIVGHGPLEAALRAQCAVLGLQSCVEFAGARSQRELPSLLRQACLLAAPSVRAASGDQEGLPVVLMEALGCACPVVASESPGVADLFGDEAAESLVPPGDVQALAAAVLRVLAQPALAQERALRLRERALQRVDWGPVASAYAVLLREACQA
jgi:glycosyltransferase involved in cell wall biosynthesis